jgi:molecular chaperone Hsp33
VGGEILKDVIHRGMDDEGNIRFVAGVTTNLIKEGVKKHLLKFPGNKVLGEFLTSTALLAAFLKEEKNSVTTHINGGGALGAVVAISDYDLFVRGYIENSSYERPFTLGGGYDPTVVIGINGYLRFITDPGFKYPYVGSVDLKTGEVEKEMTHYLIHSEQVPSFVCLEVILDEKGEIEKGGGFILQVMPNQSRMIMDEFKGIYIYRDLIPSDLGNKGSLIKFLKKMFPEKDFKILNTKTCKFRCHCSRDKMFRVLLTLGKKELELLFQEKEEVETRCHYCNEYYHFKENEFSQYI